jgi:hypothetical protein
MRFVWCVGLEYAVSMVCRAGICGLYGVCVWNMRFIWCVGLEYAVFWGVGLESTLYTVWRAGFCGLWGLTLYLTVLLTPSQEFTFKKSLIP